MCSPSLIIVGHERKASAKFLIQRSSSLNLVVACFELTLPRICAAGLAPFVIRVLPLNAKRSIAVTVFTGSAGPSRALQLHPRATFDPVTRTRPLTEYKTRKLKVVKDLGMYVGRGDSRPVG
jgi:hypothetical protein